MSSGHPTYYTLALDGDVPLDVFASAVQHWTSLLTAIASDLAIPSPRFVLTELRSGSAVLGVSMPDVDDAAHDAVAARVIAVDEGLRADDLTPFSSAIRQAAEALRDDAAQGTGYPLTIAAGNDDLRIGGAPMPERSGLSVYGSHTGRLQQFGNEGLLHERGQDRTLSVEIPEYLRERIGSLWGTDVTIRGRVIGERGTERPFRIEDVRSVEPAPPILGPEAFLAARGILKGKYATEMSPEDRIRMVRDG